MYIHTVYTHQLIINRMVVMHNIPSYSTIIVFACPLNGLMESLQNGWVPWQNSERLLQVSPVVDKDIEQKVRHFLAGMQKNMCFICSWLSLCNFKPIFEKLSHQEWAGTTIWLKGQPKRKFIRESNSSLVHKLKIASPLNWESPSKWVNPNAVSIDAHHRCSGNRCDGELP